jgi:hypothetical protein
MAIEPPQNGTFTVPEGFRLLCTCPSYFALDLVGKNITMNGVDAVWHYPDLSPFTEQPAELPSLYVRAEQADQANAVIASLDLTDFTDHHGL